MVIVKKLNYKIAVSSLSLLVIVLLISSCQPQGGVFHTVKKGQSLFRIGQTYKVDVTHLARVNGVSDPGALNPGKKIWIPGAKKQLRVPIVRGSKTSSVAKIKPRTSKKTSSTKRTTKKAPSVNNSDVDFVWPAKGSVVSKFGKQGQKLNKGIDIALPRGTPVHSAAAGKVTYSSSGIKGYGNLIIIQHDDSFFSVYGYNQKNLVTVGSFVGNNEKIALSGIPGSGGDPRLHFEIRYGKNAVNPLKYLP